MVEAPEDLELLEEIRAGLDRRPRELPSKLFYDERGSELFEEITRLPEYYLTRAELEILTRKAVPWVTALHPRSLVEFGAGSARKTRVLLEAMRSRGEATYLPVDISAEFLARTATELRHDLPGLAVEPIVADFTRGLSLPDSLPRPALLAFLGSTIGNFSPREAAALLHRLRSAMEPQDRFLLGVDLRKEIETIEAAYDDAQGVTAEFNLNLLRVVNRRFDADFDLSGFRHQAFYDTGRHRIEMHLVSTRAQRVHLPGAGTFTFEKGETIRTEISTKHDRRSVEDLFVSAHLTLIEWWEDTEGRFALAVGAPAGASPPAGI